MIILLWCYFIDKIHKEQQFNCNKIPSLSNTSKKSSPLTVSIFLSPSFFLSLSLSLSSSLKLSPSLHTIRLFPIIWNPLNLPPLTSFSFYPLHIPRFPTRVYRQNFVARFLYFIIKNFQVLNFLFTDQCIYISLSISFCASITFLYF